MAVTVVATVGSASANSFVTVTEADTYLESRLNSDLWTGTEPKKKAVIEATRDISAMSFQGNRTDATQALSWPRANAPDPDGTSDYDYFDDDEIPQRVKDATCELALEYLRAGTVDVASQDSKQNVIEKTIGPISTRYSDPSQRATGLSRYPRVMGKLSALLGIGSNQVRLTR
jgi:hypothetical protein